MGTINTIINFFKDGGFVLFPLALIFIVGVAISIERWLYLTVETARNRSLWDDVAPHLGAGNFKLDVAGFTLDGIGTATIGAIVLYHALGCTPAGKGPKENA